MTGFPCFGGGNTIGQEAGQVFEGSAWRDDVRPVQQKGGPATLHHLPTGELRAIHHLGTVGWRAEQAQMFDERRVWCRLRVVFVPGHPWKLKEDAFG